MHERQFVCVLPTSAARVLARWLTRHGMIPGLVTARGMTVSREHLAALSRAGDGTCSWDGRCVHVDGSGWAVTTAAEAQAVHDALDLACGASTSLRVPAGPDDESRP